MREKELLQKFNQMRGYFPDLLGIKIVSADKERVTGSMQIESKHLAANGYLHGGSTVTLADTTCGFGAYLNLPETADNFTTIELKSNFLRTALQGTIYCDAVAEHLGSKTQVWSATVRDEAGKQMALFRATQMILYAK